MTTDNTPLTKEDLKFAFTDTLAHIRKMNPDPGCLDIKYLKFIKDFIIDVALYGDEHGRKDQVTLCLNVVELLEAEQRVLTSLLIKKPREDDRFINLWALIDTFSKTPGAADVFWKKMKSANTFTRQWAYDIINEVKRNQPANVKRSWDY
jgi:hypothetical protein